MITARLKKLERPATGGNPCILEIVCLDPAEGDGVSVGLSVDAMPSTSRYRARTVIEISLDNPADLEDMARVFNDLMVEHGWPLPRVTIDQTPPARRRRKGWEFAESQGLTDAHPEDASV